MADTIFFYFFYNYFLRISIDLEIKRLYPMTERKEKEEEEVKKYRLLMILKVKYINHQSTFHVWV